QAVRIVTGLLARDPGRSSVGAESTTPRSHLDQAIAILDRAMSDGLRGREAAAEAFEVAQWTNLSSAAAALSQMAARFGTGDDALAALVRTQQDLTSELQMLDKTLLAALSRQDGEADPHAAAAIRERLAERNRKLADINTRLAAEFPRYA